MLLQGYKKEMFLPKCNPSFQSVHCVAHLDQDISEVLPYLNTELGGGDYAKSPPSLTLRVHGRLIALHARESCPFFPGKTRLVHWGFPDPPKLAETARSEDEALEHYRRVRDQIRAFLEELPGILEEPTEGHHG